MHIAFITPEYPHSRANYSGGLGTSIKNLVVVLLKKNINVTIFIYAQSKSEIFQEEGITFHFIENKNYSVAKWYFYRKYIQNYINKVIVKQQIDLIEAPDWTGITAFMHFKAPLVIRFHGSDTYFCYLEKRKQKWKNKLFEKLAVKKAQGYIAPTAFAGNLSSQLFKINNDQIAIIHYGLNLKHFNNESPSQYNPGSILYIGTIIRKKGVFELPIIFNKVRQNYPEAKLILIGSDSADIQTGSGSTWKLIAKEFDESDFKNVVYHGKKNYNEIQNDIKRANVCIFPTYAETLGMVTIETMAMKKPVVNSNIGWANELMIDTQSGFLVAPNNHNLFAQRICQILNNPDLYTEMGKEANKYVTKKFDVEKIVFENIQYYNTIIKNGK